MGREEFVSLAGGSQVGHEEDGFGREVLKEGQQGAWGGPRGAGLGGFPRAYWEDSALQRGFLWDGGQEPL